MKSFTSFTVALVALQTGCAAAFTQNEKQIPLDIATLEELRVENDRLRQRISELENIPKPQEWPNNTLLTSSINIQNMLAGPAAFEVYHRRGERDFKGDVENFDSLYWNDLVPANNMSSKQQVQYETLRTDWDSWRLIVKFDDSKRQLWSSFSNCSITLYDQAHSEFTTTIQAMKGGLARIWPAGRTNWEQNHYCDASIHWYPEVSAIDMNAFTFLDVQNSLSHSINITIALNPRLDKDDTARQFKTLTGLSPGASELAAYFYEANDDKKYAESWAFGVDHEDRKGNWVSGIVKCKLIAEVFGDTVPLKIANEGWLLGSGSSACEGEWDKSADGKGCEECRGDL